LGAQQQGCFFHYCQAIMRQIQKAGLQGLYETDANFALKMRHLAALAFVPVEHVESSFEQLVQRRIIPQKAHAVLDYYEDTWIGRLQTRQNRRGLRYAHPLWNCTAAILSDGPSETNNATEAWHRRFSSAVEGSHVNFYVFLGALKWEQTLTEAAYEQGIAGEQIAASQCYKKCAERLRNLVQQFVPGVTDVIGYLRGIAHNLSY
jgi:hypothetical protein